MFWFGCSDDDDCGSQTERRPSERDCVDCTTRVTQNRPASAAGTNWMDFFDVLDNAPDNECSNGVIRDGELQNMRASIDLDVLETRESSVPRSVTDESVDERCSSPSKSLTCESDAEWYASDADADVVELDVRCRSSSSASSTPVDADDESDGPPALFGAAARSRAAMGDDGRIQPVEPAVDKAPRRLHPSFEELRAEKLDDASLKEAFFGAGHKCTNLWNGKGCHVNLWGDAETGLQALKAQRA